MHVDWGGVRFEGDGGPARFDIAPDGLKGLVDGVSIRGERTDRPTSDGEYPSLMYLTARTGSIKGLIHATSPFDYEKAKRMLSAIPFRTPTILTAHTAIGELWIRARRAEAPDFNDLVYGRTAEYQVSWLAQDPRWYGEARKYPGGSVGVFHRGNYEAIPIIEVTGSRPSGYTVQSQGHEFVVTRALASGQTHRIDMSTGWLYVNGALQTSGVGAADTFTIPPGPVVNVAVSGGSGSMTVKLYDTYV